MRVGCGGCGVGGEVVQAGFCAVVVKVSSGWIRGAVERVRSLRERQETRLAGVVIPGLAEGRLAALEVFEIPQSTRWQAAGRALRLIRGSGALAVS